MAKQQREMAITQQAAAMSAQAQQYKYSRRILLDFPLTSQFCRVFCGGWFSSQELWVALDRKHARSLEVFLSKAPHLWLLGFQNPRSFRLSSY